jgi:nucleoside-diphosphate-sugar epimerase
MLTSDVHRTYRDRPVLVTGGLGFLGSNLVITLVNAGARVMIVDSSVAGCGANPFNLDPVCGKVEVFPCDIGDPEVDRPLSEADIIFNLAGEVSHIHSMLFPERDLRINTLAQLKFLEACRREAPGRRVVYASTRQVYGAPQYLPVDEQHPVAPVDFNGVHECATAHYHHLLTRLNCIDAVVLRFTNVYGPRMAIKLPCQGVLSVFLRKAVRGEPIILYGDGTQVRDPLHVSDACEALLRAGAVSNPEQRTLNVGGRTPVTLLGIANELQAQRCLPATEFVPFPAERARIDIGNYRSDSSACESTLGWLPVTDLCKGLRETLKYYDEHVTRYLEIGRPCSCPLSHS